MEDCKSPESRRKLLGLAAGVGLSAVGALPSKARAADPALFASWVHGHNVVLERSIFSPSRAAVLAAFGASSTSRPEQDGDVLPFHSSGAVAVSRLGWGARFVVFDYGTDDRPKTGEFWCHYAVPTPVFVGGRRARLLKVLVKHSPQSPSQLRIRSLHVWDGDDRVLAKDNISAPAPLVEFALPDHEVLWGMGVSLQISATSARNVRLDIHAVGIDFLV